MFEASRAKALNQLDNFVENNLAEYSRLRNFDFGPEKRSNVSCLSPYITHGIINEKEVIQKSLNKFSFSKNEKFIQEVLWRTYWKGWLELRPNVWTDYLVELNQIKNEFQNNEDYLSAIDGKTNIDCFNEWVRELKENNYLHNHTRMWFASIWIFTLRLPWQKGAEFFMKHLFDGDAASNTLSWRWVAGIQTKGKNYIAHAWNISKFTKKRYQSVTLNENAVPLIDRREYKLRPLNLNYEAGSNENLIVFENELNLENQKLKEYKNIYLILLTNKIRKIKFEKKILDYKIKLIRDQKKRFNKIQLMDEVKFQPITEKIKSFDMIYPCVGENYSFINNMKKKNNLKLNIILRDEDKFSWQFSNKGFFNFKNNIIKIFNKFNLN